MKCVYRMRPYELKRESSTRCTKWVEVVRSLCPKVSVP